MPAIAFSQSAELRARLAVSLMIAALLPVFVMDAVVLHVDFANAWPGFIESVVIATGVLAALVGLVLGWTLTGQALRSADERVEDATSRLFELARDLEAERSRLARAMEGSRLATWELDMPSGAIHLSANWSSLMGGPPGEMVVPISQLIDRVPAEEQARCWEAVKAVLHGSTDYYDVEHRVRRDDGSMLWIRSRGAVSARSADGRVLRMTGTNFDVTERRHAELALQQSEAKLRLVADSVPVMVTYLDAELRFLFANEKYLDFFGVNLEGVLGRPLREIAGEEAEAAVRGHLAELQQGRQVRFEHDRTDRDGASRNYEVRIVPQPAPEGSPRGFFTVIQDVTERTRAVRAFAHMAMSDPLTGLPNKRLLLDRLEHAIAQRGRREGSVAVLFIDLDGFKEVNDTMGHAAGDAVLQAVAARLRTSARHADTIARLGGDEFVMLLEACPSPREAEQVAAKVAASLSQPYAIAAGSAQITCSIGIAIDAGGEPAEALLRHADLAMYRAKKAGKNRFALHAEAAD